MTEEKHRRTRIRKFIPVLLMALLLMTILCWMILERTEEIYSGDGMVISVDSGFYTGNQILQVEVPKGAEVYYTEDCEPPDRENGIRYTAPIYLKSDKEEKVYVYRFKAFYRDGTESPVETRVYFTGTDIDERYTTNVLHITGDPEGLFGYEEGIFVPGKLFDEFKGEDFDGNFGVGVEANFTQRGIEWEREVYIQYFDADGREILSQNGGVRISGGATRMKNQKSFRLYARKEYDEKNKFNYAFLDGLVSEDDNTLAQKYKRLTIRSGGSDNGFAYLRSELASSLAADAGFPDVMYASPVTVYINGIYQGIYWLENGYDGQYFESRYGAYDGKFVVMEGVDNWKDDAEDDAEQPYVDEYNAIYNRFSSMDLTLEENYQELLKYIDVENYLQYFAIENYIGNADWPNNNLKAYRYVSEDGSYTEGTVFDGRYRHLLFDLDWSFGLLLLNDMVGILPESSTLEKIMGEDTPLFAALMEREDCRQYFINYTCDLMNGAMSPDHVSERLADMHESRNRELYHMLVETEHKEEAMWNWESVIGTYENVEKNYTRILEYAINHPPTVYEDISEYFIGSNDDVYTLYIYFGDAYSSVQINSIYADGEEFSASYFASVPITLKPCTVPNETFQHWMVNGQVREEEELKLDGRDVLDGEIHVELVVDEAEEPLLQIKALRAKGAGDFVELVNYSNQPVSTLGYFLSDNGDCYQYALPAMTLQPGESRRFYGKDCLDNEGLGQIALNFNLKQNETVTLTYRGLLIEELAIPDLSDGGIYERDISTGEFTETK